MAEELTDFEDTVSEGPQRLDRWLRDRLPGWSMQRVRKLVKEGRVLVNGAPARKGLCLRPGDEVVVRGLPGEEPPLADPTVSFKTAYQDRDLVVADKPAGIPTHPLSPDESGTLVNGMVARYPDLRKAGGGKLEPGLLHRLDAGTSGLVMFARNKESYDFMRREFEMRRVRKFYRAVAARGIKRDWGEIRAPLAHHPKEPGLMVAALAGSRFRGKPMKALTRYRVLERRGDRTLVELELVTGVTHQLRAHLAYIGHPVLGDDRYGENPEPGSKTFCLQASRLIFVHPRTGEKVEVEADALLEL